MLGLPCDGLACHPGGRRNTTGRFMLQKLGQAPAWWATWLVYRLYLYPACLLIRELVHRLRRLECFLFLFFHLEFKLCNSKCAVKTLKISWVNGTIITIIANLRQPTFDNRTLAASQARRPSRICHWVYCCWCFFVVFWLFLHPLFCIPQVARNFWIESLNEVKPVTIGLLKPDREVKLKFTDR